MMHQDLRSGSRNDAVPSQDRNGRDVHVVKHLIAESRGSEDGPLAALPRCALGPAGRNPQSCVA
jgi:hypothetical protein